MGIFARHIIKRLFFTYAILCLLLILFFILLHYVEYVDDFFDRDATLAEVIGVYYPSYIPEILRLVSPAAMFLACIFLTSKLAQQLQITSLFASGVSLYRLLIPYLLVGFFVSVGMFYFNGWVVPKANVTRIAFEEKFLRNSITTEAGIMHRQVGANTILSVAYYDKNAQVAHRISIQKFKENRNLESRIDALQMNWVDTLKIWRIQGGKYRTFLPNGSEREKQLASLDTALVFFPSDLTQSESDVQLQTITEAKSYINSLERIGISQMGLALVNYYDKFFYPFANLIVVLIGVSMSSRRRKGGQAMQMGIGLLVAYVYLALMLLSQPFGYAGEISPLLAVVLPHLLFLCIGLVLVFKYK